MAIPRNLANIAPHVNASSTELVVNDGGANLDFRVEGDTDANLLFVDAGADAVGIGSTVEGSSKLTVKGAGIAISRDSSGVFNTTAYDIKIRSASPKIGIHATSSSQDMTLDFSGGGSANAIIDVVSNDGLVFRTNNSERARITSGGDFYIGASSPGFNSRFVVEKNGGDVVGFGNTSATAGQTVMTLKGGANGTDTTTVYAIFQRTDGTSRGNITATGTNGVIYNTSSDYRLKNITGKVAGYKERIMALQPKQGTWKGDGSQFKGFLAHEFAEQYPNAVSGEKDEVDSNGEPKYQGMQAGNSETIADLIAFVQELKTELDIVKAELATLKG